VLSIIELDVFRVPVFGNQFETFHAYVQAVLSVFRG